MGLMSTGFCYSDLFDLMMSLVSKPDLLIYLKSSIESSPRSRSGAGSTKSIRIDYLTGLNKRYEDWIQEYDGELLVVNVDDIKFENRPEDFRTVTDKIDAKMFGLFSAVREVSE